MASQDKLVHEIAEALGANSVIELEQTNATLQHTAAGRNWNGPIYVATPQLLKAFGIKPSAINPNADILTMRPGLSGISKMQLTGAVVSGAESKEPKPLNACPKTSYLESGHPRNRRLAFRNIRAEHRLHRTRHPRTWTPDVPRRLVDQNRASADGGADQERTTPRVDGFRNVA